MSPRNCTGSRHKDFCSLQSIETRADNVICVDLIVLPKLWLHSYVYVTRWRGFCQKIMSSRRDWTQVNFPTDCLLDAIRCSGLKTIKPGYITLEFRCEKKSMVDWPKAAYHSSNWYVFRLTFFAHKTKWSRPFIANSNVYRFTRTMFMRLM